MQSWVVDRRRQHLDAPAIRIDWPKGLADFCTVRTPAR